MRKNALHFLAFVFYFLHAPHLLAVGWNGFPPTTTNVVAKSTGQTVQNWQQVGTCVGGNSATQISPHWILTAAHSNCPAGSTFRRQDGASAMVDLDPPTQPGQKALNHFDLHLSRLQEPLPLPNGLNFSILAEQFPTRSDLNLGLTKNTDVLSAGYGKLLDASGNYVTPISKPFQVGWAPLGRDGAFPSAPANPHSMGFANVTGDDSGGGVFVYNSVVPNGALIGLIQSMAFSTLSSGGFPQGVREQIDAVLANPVLNPSGEQLQWVDGTAITGNPARPYPPPWFEKGGFDENYGGLVTSRAPGTLRIQFSNPDWHQSLSPIGATAYRLRLVEKRYLGTSENSYNYSTTLMPHQNDFSIGNGIFPGHWYLTLTALNTQQEVDPETGETTLTQVESLASDRVEFFIPASQDRPLALAQLNVSFVRQDFGAGELHWRADFVGTTGDGPAIDGILWYLPHNRLYLWKDRTHSVYENDFPNGMAPGQSFYVTAYPYVGAAIGPATTLRVTVPSTFPAE